MITRQEIHEAIDDILDAWGYKEEIPVNFGGMLVELKVQNGKVVTEIRERMSNRTIEAKAV